MWQLVTYLFAYLVLHAVPASEVSENLSYQYYRVNAKAEQPLLPQLLAASPVREKDVTYVGNTIWNVEWRFDWKTNDNGECVVTDSSTKLDVVVILPELHGGSELQTEAFDRYLEALRRHELNHYKIAAEAARKIDTDLKSLPRMKSCKTLEAYANALSRKTLERHNKKSREYDLKTDHGHLEGV